MGDVLIWLSEEWAMQLRGGLYMSMVLIVCDIVHYTLSTINYKKCQSEKIYTVSC